MADSSRPMTNSDSDPVPVPELYDFGRDDGQLHQGLPPIVGSDGGSAWFARGGHVAVPTMPLGPEASEGVFIGFDVQPDTLAEQVVLGSAKRGASTVKVVVNEANVPGRVCLVLEDEDGKSLVARADASRSIARRLLLTANPSTNLVAMFEVQPWARDPGRQLTVDIELAEGPSRFVFDQPLTFAGCLEDGSLAGTFAGRLSEIFIGTRLLSDSEVAELAKASDNPTALTHGDLQSPSHELRGRFLRDIDRLRHWYRAPRLSLDDMDDASLLLFRWLFSTHPVMPVLCRKLGIQLWLPGDTDRGRAFHELTRTLGPVIHFAGQRGPDRALGLAWRTVQEWRTEPVFTLGELAVSREMFVKFVRNKLGPGHFDEVDRSKWQRDLKAVADATRMWDQDAFAYQMHGLVRELILGVAASRLEPVICGPAPLGEVE